MKTITLNDFLNKLESADMFTIAGRPARDFGDLPELEFFELFNMDDESYRFSKSDNKFIEVFNREDGRFSYANLRRYDGSAIDVSLFRYMQL